MVGRVNEFIYQKIENDTLKQPSVAVKAYNHSGRAPGRVFVFDRDNFKQSEVITGVAPTLAVDSCKAPAGDVTNFRNDGQGLEERWLEDDDDGDEVPIILESQAQPAQAVAVGSEAGDVFWWRACSREPGNFD